MRQVNWAKFKNFINFRKALEQAKKDHDEAFKSFDLETFVNKDQVQHMYKLNEAQYYPDASSAMLENRYLHLAGLPLTHNFYK